MTLQEKQSQAVDQAKKPYSPPQLIIYGDLVELTMRGMTGQDGNKTFV
jgi:hypothetical protein